MAAAPPLTAAELWVKQVTDAMTFDEKLGQLIVLRAHSNLGDDHVASVEALIKQYKVGGLCFFQGTPEKQAELTNRYQRLSKIPLMISMDAEWGLSMRLKETCIIYPRQLMLGAIQDNTLIYRFGRQVATECRRLGVHVNFAPDADVNNNPKNPVINDRSFGENKENVATKAFMYMRGMQDNGVLACAKHFPGHGDTDADSHLDLPLITHDMARLNALEMMPFRVLAQAGVGSMMAAHLQIPAIDNTANLPTSLSHKAVTDILRKQLGFDGIIFTDGLEMKGVTKYYNGGDVEAMSIAAGNDVLLLPESVSNAIEKIKKYMKEGKIDSLEIEKSVHRVLKAKYQLNLTTPQTIDLNGLRYDLNDPYAQGLKRELIQNALTVVRNEDSLLPFRRYQPEKMVSLALGASSQTAFQQQFRFSAYTPQYQVGKTISETYKRDFLAQTVNAETIIVSLHGMEPKAATDFGLSTDMINFVNQIATTKKVVLIVFGNPYALKYFDSPNIKTILECYNEDKMTQELAAQGLFGAFEFKGKLPVTASERIKSGYGYVTPKRDILEWNLDSPEAVGMDSKKLNQIDNIANDLIAAGAAPSCQILVARNGKVVYHKAFGYKTYEKTEPATLDDLYDLASITKVAATTVSLMHLADAGKFDINQKMSTYLPLLRGSNKENLLLKNILIHEAGLKDWIAFYKETLDKSGKPSTKYYSTTQSDGFFTPVANHLFMRNDYVDSMKRQIVLSPLRENTQYKYSDLGMILMADVIRNITGKTLDQYATEHFYRPLGMSQTLFNPTTRFSESQIAPTERDTYFRHADVRGSVHDMGAAMLGGVSGHAGLFSTTSDLVKLCQMLLNGGTYDGMRLLEANTVKMWTQRFGGSTRRGLGWDMKETGAGKTENMSPYASLNTFGHTGFTGNAAYIDPDKQLIYIFLSNRTFPTMENNKLINGNYRTKIQSTIYEAIKK